MKILFYTTQLGRSYVQGTERYVTTLASGLREHGHKVVHLAGDPLGQGPSAALGHCIDERQNIHAMPTTGWMTIVGRDDRPIRKYLKAVSPDIVHVNNAAHVGVGVLRACRDLGIPYVVTVHDFWWLCPKGILLRPDGTVCDATPDWTVCTQCIAADHHRQSVTRLGKMSRLAAPLTALLFGARGVKRGMPSTDVLRWTKRRSILVNALQSAEAIIFPSQAIADVFASHLPAERCHVVPNGVDHLWFQHRRPPIKAVLEPDRMTIGYAGALSPHKAPHLLLQAIRRLGWFNTTVRFAGTFSDPDYEKQMHKEASGLKVRFHGRLGAEQMVAYLRGLDLLAVTSIWPENYPYVVIEAQALGVPVVGSRIGGIVDQVGNDKMLFETGSRESLAETLEYIRTHPDEITCGKVSTVGEMTDQIEAIYADALGTQP